jgi:hypothetical protein
MKLIIYPNDNAIRTGKEFLGQVVTTVYTGKTTIS